MTPYSSRKHLFPHPAACSVQRPRPCKQLSSSDRTVSAIFYVQLGVCCHCTSHRSHAQLLNGVRLASVLFAERWQTPYGGSTVGLTVLSQRGLFIEDWWRWVGIGSLLGFCVLFNILILLAQTYLNREPPMAPSHYLSTQSTCSDTVGLQSLTCSRFHSMLIFNLSTVLTSQKLCPSVALCHLQEDPILSCQCSDLWPSSCKMMKRASSVVQPSATRRRRCLRRSWRSASSTAPAAPAPSPAATAARASRHRGRGAPTSCRAPTASPAPASTKPCASSSRPRLLRRSPAPALARLPPRTAALRAAATSRWALCPVRSAVPCHLKRRNYNPLGSAPPTENRHVKMNLGCAG